jgi:hypothetical protein
VDFADLNVMNVNDIAGMDVLSQKTRKLGNTCSTGDVKCSSGVSGRVVV